jgi:oxygen-independent coproporphyrinogen-3 oxidase
VLGLYVHIPFCSAICAYCNFNRGLLDEDLKRRYVAAVAREIARDADGSPADTVYFGGGTPSLLSGEEIGRVVRACRNAFDVAADAEITLEVNPETVTSETVDAWRLAGITRLSLGVQSFRDDELRRLGRVHDAARARHAFRLARRGGFDNVSLDLMMWLPQQSLDDWLESVDALVDMGPDHASLYLLELYPNAPLRENMARAGWRLPPDDLAAEMYLRAFSRLEAAGYRQYEISNVARPARESRHNLKYWRDGEWLAFGCGAHGTRRGVRWRNVAATADYVAGIEAGADVVAERRVLSRADRFGEAMFMGLRLAEGVDLDDVARRYDVDVWGQFGPRLAPMVEAGLLRRAQGRLALTRNGMLLANEVMAVFV